MERNKLVSALVVLGLMALLWLNNNPPKAATASSPTPPTETRVSLPQAQPSPATPEAQPSPATPEAQPCQGHIWYVTRSGAEVRFGYTGNAERVHLEWLGGSYEVAAADACTGTECKATLPRPALSEVRIRLDGCPWEKIP
jgi:hypothetical protein